MASGTIVKDYRLLIAYFEELNNLGIKSETSYPTSEDIEFIVSSIRQGRVRNLAELIDILIERFRSRVNVIAALNACKKTYGEFNDGELAVHEVAKLLAGWAIEIAENLGLIKLKNVDYYLR